MHENYLYIISVQVNYIHIINYLEIVDSIVAGTSVILLLELKNGWFLCKEIPKRFNVLTSSYFKRSTQTTTYKQYQSDDNILLV